MTDQTPPTEPSKKFREMDPDEQKAWVTANQTTIDELVIAAFQDFRERCFAATAAKQGEAAKEGRAP